MKRIFFFLLISFLFGKTYAMVHVPIIVVDHSKSAALISSVTVRLEPDESLPGTNRLEDTAEYKTTYSVKELNKYFDKFLNGMFKEETWININKNWQKTFDFCATLITTQENYEDFYENDQEREQFPDTRKNIAIVREIKRRFSCRNSSGTWWNKIIHGLSRCGLETNLSGEYYQMIEILKLYFVVQFFDIEIIHDSIIMALGFYVKEFWMRTVNVPNGPYNNFDYDAMSEIISILNRIEIIRYSFAFRLKKCEEFFLYGLNPAAKMAVYDKIMEIERFEDDFDYMYPHGLE